MDLHLHTLAAAGLFALALITLTLPAPTPARADTPQLFVHITHTRDWTEAGTGRMPAGPIDNMSYHGGPAQSAVRAYTIFWIPSGYSSPFPAGYQSLINRYFADVGHSPYYNIVSQYYQEPGPVNLQNVSVLGGTWVDTQNPFPRAGTGTDPLLLPDLQAEAVRAATVNHWPAGINNHFFVFTPPGVETCVDNTSGCTPGVTAAMYLFCAYHWGYWTGDPNNTLEVSNMPYVMTWSNGCGLTGSSPNNNPGADAEIIVLSHEHLEGSTNPLGNAWYDANTGGEIGDKCNGRVGTLAPDGHNVMLNGNRYVVQQQWSNADNNGTPYSGCVLQYGAPGVTLWLPLLRR